MQVFVYMLRCSDGSYYIGLTRDELQMRIAQHNAGTFGGYTRSRRPVTLLYSESFENASDAVRAERQLKGWSRAKKEALIRGDIEALKRLSRNRTEYPHPSSSSG